jgi:hypothetical protein
MQRGINKKSYNIGTCGLYYKPMMIVNDDSRVFNKLEASLTDNARVVIYDCQMFIVQATGVNVIKLSPQSRSKLECFSLSILSSLI